MLLHNLFETTDHLSPENVKRLSEFLRKIENESYDVNLTDILNAMVPYLASFTEFNDSDIKELNALGTDLEQLMQCFNKARELVNIEPRYCTSY